MNNQTSCGALIKQIHDELEKRVNNALRPLDLTMAQIGVLLALSESDGGTFSLKQLEQLIHVAQSTAAGIVSRLEKKGLVEGYGDSSDRRIKMVHITEAGIACCMDAERYMNDTEKEMMSGLTEEEQTIFRMLLMKVRNSVK